MAAKLKPEAMRRNLHKASSLLAAMANEKRLMILCQLVEGERSVGELADLLDTRQSTVSQHLALLRKDGYVRCRRDGQHQHYWLASEEARRLVGTLYELYCTPPLRRKAAARR